MTEKHQLIVYHAACGISYSKITKLLQVYRSTIASIVQQFNQDGKQENSKKSGHPKIVAQRDM